MNSTISESVMEFQPSSTKVGPPRSMCAAFIWWISQIQIPLPSFALALTFGSTLLDPAPWWHSLIHQPLDLPIHMSQAPADLSRSGLHLINVADPISL